MSCLHIWFSKLKWSMDVLLRFYERHAFICALHKETRLLFDELIFCLQVRYLINISYIYTVWRNESNLYISFVSTFRGFIQSHQLYESISLLVLILILPLMMSITTPSVMPLAWLHNRITQEPQQPLLHHHLRHPTDSWVAVEGLHHLLRDVHMYVFRKFKDLYTLEIQIWIIVSNYVRLIT